MQFRLRTLLVAITFIAMHLAVFFAVPIYVELPLLAMVVLVSPAFWNCGACFAKGSCRPFFVGAICAGWIPHVALLYTGFGMVAPVFSGFSSVENLEDWGMGERLLAALVYSFPGFCALLGGTCGMLVYRWFGPEQTKPADEPSKLRDAYVLVESRLTPLAPEVRRPSEAVDDRA